MPADDTYRTLAAPGRAAFKERGSRFAAEAHPADTEAEAQRVIAEIRRRDYDATHVCTAYRVGPAGDVFRYDDDGEPSGSAGAPILRQIDGRGLTNTVVAVTRYYGGTKLGTGGLVRAYGDAAAGALEDAREEERVLRRGVHVRFDYDDTSPALHTVGRFDAETVSADYGADTRMTLAVRRSQADAFAAAFIEALGGRGDVRIEGEEEDDG